MLVSKIQRDLFDFIKDDPDEASDLIQFWYLSNSNALSAALTKHDGFKLIVNVADFTDFDELSKRLFLITDTIILRDTRKLTPEEIKPRCGIFDNYQPNFWNDLEIELNSLKPSPFTLQYSPSAYLNSTSKILNNGYKALYAMDITHNPIPDNYIDWIMSSGQKHLQSGTIVYAPFIPPLEMELDLLQHNVSLPETFNASSCFHNQFNYLDKKAFDALLKLKLPYCENLDVEILSKIKQDNYDTYSDFSSAMLYALSHINNSVGSANFNSEVQYIQKHLIDDKLNSLNVTIQSLKKYQSLKKLGLLIGVCGVTTSIIKPEFATLASITGLAPTLFDLVADMRKAKVIPQQQPYFLWQVSQKVK